MNISNLFEKLKELNIKKEIIFWVLTGCLFLLFLSVISYNPNDPSFTTFSTKNVENICGPIGAVISDLIVQTFGLSAILIPFAILLYLVKIFRKDRFRWVDIIFFLFFILSLSYLFTIFLPGKIEIKKGFILPGGFTGYFLYNFFVKYFNLTGAVIIAFIFFFIFLILTFKFSIINFFLNIPKFFKSVFNFVKEKTKFKKKEKSYNKQGENIKQDVKIKVKKISNKKKKGTEKDSEISDEELPPFPPLSLLTEPPKESKKIDSEYLNSKKEVLLEKFKDFGIVGEVVDIITGPVVTLFEFQPAPGIKLSKITGLANDLTMALKALSVRIVAPIPGKSVVGIEIPNEKREIVFFKEIVNSGAFNNSKSLLTIALGKTIDGTPYVSDLSKMPHLLVAGSTGSGKSVCINTILISILYRAAFNEVKFILVDPKMLELSVYNNIPHLLLPVVTDPEKAAIALRWAIGEMERRYELLSDAEVRDIASFNRQTKDESKKLPYIVIVIDELADLMMVAPKDVETSIARLTQKARAAGIHLILATQRPSVDVITGVIKNNLPSRIAFKVTSRADSRTIIDSMGAESLLGYGDMLFIPPGVSNPVRLQGAFITNDEILKVTNYLKSISSPHYIEEEILNYEPENKSSKGSSDIDELDDPVYKEAVEFVKTLDTVSISMLQRRFKIGYNRSATFIEKMEEAGIVSSADGSKPRKVLIK